MEKFFKKYQYTIKACSAFGGEFVKLLITWLKD